MGLTIHYKLRAKGAVGKARKLVENLHQQAHDLPFKELGNIVDLAGDECDYEKRDKNDPLRWMLIQAHGTFSLSHLPGETEHSSHYVSPKRVIAFTAWPGEGCEESNFGLCKFPATITTERHGKIKTRLDGWRWASFVKSQYASDPNCGGVQNFLRCHLSVIAMLDKAKQLGCLESASDEGGFWEQRNLEALVKEIGSWNEMIAAFGGKLKDLLGGGIEMPIKKYPNSLLKKSVLPQFPFKIPNDFAASFLKIGLFQQAANFEHLELAGQSQLPPETKQLAKLIKQVCQKP